jgi:hypothetical protein
VRKDGLEDLSIMEAQDGDLLISGRFFVILHYILFLNERISIFYKVMSILSLEYFVCFFPETWWEFHDVGE